MNRRKLPLNALRAFEAAARHASVTGAAVELSVTHSAVSHQLRQLESKLGTKLFHRTNRGLNITAAGETLLPALMQSFDHISETLDKLQQLKQIEVIRVTCTPSFASRWLVPRLGDWYSTAGASRIHLLPDLDNLDFHSDHIDLAIRCGEPPWDNLKHELLMPIHLIPVCSPAYLNKIGPVTGSTDLLRHDLIHADIGGHQIGEEWGDWLSGCGVLSPKPTEGLCFHDPALAIQAAADGLGLAVTYQELISDDLHSNRLVVAWDQPVKHQYAYYLVYPTPVKNEALLNFINWMPGA